MDKKDILELGNSVADRLMEQINGEKKVIEEGDIKSILKKIDVSHTNLKSAWLDLETGSEYNKEIEKLVNDIKALYKKIKSKG